MIREIDAPTDYYKEITKKFNCSESVFELLVLLVEIVATNDACRRANWGWEFSRTEMESCIGTFFVTLRGSESIFGIDRSANLVWIIYLERTRRYLVSSLVRSFIRTTYKRYDKSFIINSPLRSLYLFRSFPFIFSGCQRVSEYVSGVSEEEMYVPCKR